MVETILDILCGLESSIDTVLVLSGVTSREGINYYYCYYIVVVTMVNGSYHSYCLCCMKFFRKLFAFEQYLSSFSDINSLIYVCNSDLAKFSYAPTYIKNGLENVCDISR